MKTTGAIAVSLLGLGALLSAPIIGARAETAENQAAGSSAAASENSKRADAYYYFTLGHTNELEYEMNGRGEAASQAIENYKKALEIDPDSVVIMERLAEIYATSQNIRHAVVQEQEVTKHDA